MVTNQECGFLVRARGRRNALDNSWPPTCVLVLEYWIRSWSPAERNSWDQPICTTSATHGLSIVRRTTSLYSVLDAFVWCASCAVAAGPERSGNSHRFLSCVLPVDNSCQPGFSASDLGHAAGTSNLNSGPKVAICSRDCCRYFANHDAGSGARVWPSIRRLGKGVVLAQQERIANAARIGLLADVVPDPNGCLAPSAPQGCGIVHHNLT